MEEIDYLDQDIQLENGTAISVNFLRKYSYVLDPAYGADGDGNRACVVWFLDEDDFSDVSVRCFKGFVDLAKLRQRNQIRVEAAIAKWCFRNVPERKYD